MKHANGEISLSGWTLPPLEDLQSAVMEPIWKSVELALKLSFEDEQTYVTPAPTKQDPTAWRIVVNYLAGSGSPPVFEFSMLAEVEEAIQHMTLSKLKLMKTGISEIMAAVEEQIARIEK